jgi:predicted nuclease of restriction endonuclease-like (RecB) superfamily
MKPKRRDPLYTRICGILESARSGIARSVNTTQVVANWLIGREIVEEEQRGKVRANYGARLIEVLSRRLTADYGSGYSLSLLKDMKVFYFAYPHLLGPQGPHAKGPALPGLLPGAKVSSPKGPALPGLLPGADASSRKGPAVRGFLPVRDSSELAHATSGKETTSEISDMWRRQIWQPGHLHPHLSWTHYRTLLRVDTPEARAFYEIEATKSNWSTRELERQINSLLYQRLALSKDNKGLLRLAKKGHEVQTPADVFKDPLVLEFLGLPAAHRLVESDLESGLIGNLQAFLLELGKGFAFVARQERITLDGDHFYIDLVFYHTLLKCFILIDLKVGKLTHQDLGQLQLYVNYYDRHRRTPGDQPTLGLILCTDKNDAVVKYTLGEGEGNHIFASRYRLLVPTEAELKAEMRRELKRLLGPG